MTMTDPIADMLTRIRNANIAGHKTVDVQCQDADRDKILEDRLHPVLDLQAFTRIGFLDEVVPTPAKLVAAEDREKQRAERQSD